MFYLVKDLLIVVDPAVVDVIFSEFVETSVFVYAGSSRAGDEL